MGDKLKQIYYCENNSILYSENYVKNGIQEIILENIDNGITTEEYAKTLMREHYKKILSRQYENIVLLTGAGTSVNIGDGEKQGKTMKGLWTKVVENLTFETLEAFAESINFENIQQENTDLEALLSKAILSESYKHQDEVKNVIDKIEKIIREECTLKLPNNSPHELLLRKLTSRKLKYSRVKIFTLNYDLLFEQAASKGGYVIIDGFSFNTPRIFNGINYDYDIVIRNNNRSLSEENYAPKVFHLYKPHGSLDWDREESGIVVKKNEPKNTVMIYPSSSKYEASYEQPYFEMISRFQNELRKKNTLLIVIGFSFYDKHITAMIDEAINSNPSITVVAVSRDVERKPNMEFLREKSMKQRGIILISESFDEFTKQYPYSEIYDYNVRDEENNESI